MTKKSLFLMTGGTDADHRVGIRFDWHHFGEDRELETLLLCCPI